MTFIKRHATDDGHFLCLACLDAQDSPLVLDDLLDSVPASTGVVSSANRYPVLPAITTTPRNATVATASTGNAARFWIVLGSTLGAVLLVGWIVWLFWPTWEDSHKDQLRALLARAGEADGRHDIRSAYATYDQVVTMSQGQAVTSSMLVREIAVARASRDRLFPQVAAQLEKERKEEEAAVRAAEAARQQQEAARSAAERATKIALAERERADRQAAALAAARQAEMQKIERIRSSLQFAGLVRDAQQLYSRTAAELVTEDSAYRAMSRWSETGAQLAGILARQQGLIQGTSVDAQIQLIEQRRDIEMTGEDSAIRATYKHDRAMLDVLAVLSRVWTSDNAVNRKLVMTSRRLATDTGRRVGDDDSAPRAISAYNNALVREWADLATARGQDVAALVQAADRGIATEQSAWRAADRMAETQARIVLAILAAEAPQRAREIEQTMQMSDASETSALRSVADKKRAVAETLAAIVALRGAK